VLFIITFSLNNTDPVYLAYYDFFDLNVPSYILIFVCFGAGVVLAGLFGMVERLRLSRKVNSLKRQIRRLEEQASTVEAEPVETGNQG
jgi:uncharacterized integral membrane protein